MRGEGSVCRVGAPRLHPHPLQLSFPSASIQASFLSFRLRKTSFLLSIQTLAVFPFSLPPPHPSVPFAGAFSVAALGIVGNIGVPSRAAFCALPTQWGSVAVGCQAGVVVPNHEGPSANRACFPHVLWGPEHPDGPGEGTKCPLAVLPTEGRCIPGVEAQLVAPGGSGDTLLMSPALHPSACALHSSHRSSPWSCLFP